MTAEAGAGTALARGEWHEQDRGNGTIIGWWACSHCGTRLTVDADQAELPGEAWALACSKLEAECAQYLPPDP